MPTVGRVGPYRFFFYSADGGEPPHVHVARDDSAAKFWLTPVRLENNQGFSRAALRDLQRIVGEHSEAFLGPGMISSVETHSPRALRVEVTEDSLLVDLVDGRSITVPLGWYPRLAHGTPVERSHWKLTGNGEGVHWPDLDEDVSILGVIMGRGSQESSPSLNRWLARRGGVAAPAPPPGTPRPNRPVQRDQDGVIVNAEELTADDVAS